MNEIEKIRIELIKMAQEDQQLRAALATEGSLYDGYHPTMEKIHNENAARLLKIVDQYGWTIAANFGDQSTNAAWLILQHAIGHPEMQRQGLVRLQALALRGLVPKVQVAFLEDRIRSDEGKPQLYGSQFDWDENGQLSPYPIEDLQNVDKRRASIGLGPLQDDIFRHRELANKNAEKPPKNWAARENQKLEWLRKSGWRR